MFKVGVWEICFYRGMWYLAREAVGWGDADSLRAFNKVKTENNAKKNDRSDKQGLLFPDLRGLSFSNNTYNASWSLWLCGDRLILDLGWLWGDWIEKQLLIILVRKEKERNSTLLCLFISLLVFTSESCLVCKRISIDWILVSKAQTRKRYEA